MEISVTLIQKEKRKKGKAQGKAQDSKQKKKEKKKEEKKNTLQEDLSFSAPHTIRPPARGRVTSFPAHTNLTDKYT